MDKFDRMIAEALSAEDRALLEDLAEPGFFGLVFGSMKGRSGWVVIVTWASQILMFVAALWAAWHFFAASDVLAAVKWGIPAGVLMLGSLQLKLSMVPYWQADRIILALRRMEVALMRR